MGLTYLKRSDLDAHGPRDISVLMALTALQSLCLRSCKAVADGGPVFIKSLYLW